MKTMALGNEKENQFPSLAAVSKKQLAAFFKQLRTLLEKDPSLGKNQQIIRLCREAASLFGPLLDQKGKKIEFAQQPLLFLDRLISSIKKELSFGEEEISHGQIPSNLKELVAALETALAEEEATQALREKTGLELQQARTVVRAFIEAAKTNLPSPKETPSPTVAPETTPFIAPVASRVLATSLEQQPDNPQKTPAPFLRFTAKKAVKQVVPQELSPRQKKALQTLALRLGLKGPAFAFAAAAVKQASPPFFSLLPPDHPQRAKTSRTLARILVAQAGVINPVSLPASASTLTARAAPLITQFLSQHHFLLPSSPAALLSLTKEALGLAPPKKTPPPSPPGTEALLRLSSQPSTARQKARRQLLTEVFHHLLTTGSHPLVETKAKKAAALLARLNQEPTKGLIGRAPEAVLKITFPAPSLPKIIKNSLPSSLQKRLAQGEALSLQEIILNLPPPLLAKIDTFWPLTEVNSQGEEVITARGVVEGLRLAALPPKELAAASQEWQTLARNLSPEERQNPLLSSLAARMKIINQFPHLFKRRLFSSIKKRVLVWLVKPIDSGVKVISFGHFSSLAELGAWGWNKIKNSPFGQLASSWIRAKAGDWVKKTGSKLVKKLAREGLKTAAKTLVDTLATALGISSAALTAGLSLIITLLPKIISLAKKGLGFIKEQLKKLGLDFDLGIKSFLEKNLGFGGKLLGGALEAGTGFLAGLTATIALPLAPLLLGLLAVTFLLTSIVIITSGGALFISSEKGGSSSFIQNEIKAMERGVEPEGNHPAVQLERALRACGLTSLTANNFSLNAPGWDCLKKKGIKERQLNELYYSVSHFETLQCVGFKKAAEANFPGGHNAAWFARNGPKITDPPQVGDNAVWGPTSSCRPGDNCQTNVACCGHIGVITKIEKNIAWVTQAWGDNGQVNTIKIPLEEIERIIRYNQ